MSWLSLTIIAQLLNSVVAILDKYLVTSKKITTPILYVFYTGALSFLGILVYLPAFFSAHGFWPKFSNIDMISPWVLFLIVVASISQLTALWAMFSSLKKNDASDVVPVIGSFSAVFALLIGYFFSNLVLPVHFTIGFVFLVVGTLLISHLKFSKKIFIFTLISGLGFAMHSLLLKESLRLTSFDTGFFWYAVIVSLLAGSLIILPQIRKTFHSHKKEKHIKSTGALLLGNKVVAGIAGILLIKAIEIGEVSLVQALGGLQFVFLFVLAVLLGPLTPIDFGENVKRKDVYHKLVSIGIIFVGFVLLFM